MNMEPSRSDSEQAGQFASASPPLPSQFSTGMIVNTSLTETAALPHVGVTTHRSYSSSRMDLIVCDLTYRSDHELEIYGPSLLKIAFNEVGHLDLEFDGDRSVFNSRAECCVTMQPEGVRKVQRNRNQDQLRCAQLVMHPEYFLEEIPWAVAELPGPLKSFIQGQSGMDFFRFPMSNTMRRCAAEVIRVNFDDPLASILLEGKSIELLYHFVDGWKRLRGRETISSEAARNSARLYDIKHLLDDEYCSPKSLHELAAMVGMSKSRLAVAFRTRFGMSIGEYCLRRRMMTARQMVAMGDVPLSVIAYQVGYEHQSSFTSAYRSYFGVPPSADRAD